jgi:hypothetical protein
LITIRQDSAFTFRQVLITMSSIGPDARVRMTGVVGSGLAEEGGEGGDGFEEQGVDAGLLVGGAALLKVGDCAAVLGLAGELADAGRHGRVNGCVAARDASRG